LKEVVVMDCRDNKRWKERRMDEGLWEAKIREDGAEDLHVLPLEAPYS
jgi:hypothetical protein